MESSLIQSENESRASEQGEKEEINDIELIQHTIKHVLDHLDNILYRKHILQWTQKTVFDALETAFYDFINLYFIGETFPSLCTPATFQLENDIELEEFPKDDLQL